MEAHALLEEERVVQVVGGVPALGEPGHAAGPGRRPSPGLPGCCRRPPVAVADAGVAVRSSPGGSAVVCTTSAVACALHAGGPARPSIPGRAPSARTAAVSRNQPRPRRSLPWSCLHPAARRNRGSLYPKPRKGAQGARRRSCHHGRAMRRAVLVLLAVALDPRRDRGRRCAEIRHVGAAGRGTRPVAERSRPACAPPRPLRVAPTPPADRPADARPPHGPQDDAGHDPGARAASPWPGYVGGRAFQNRERRLPAGSVPGIRRAPAGSPVRTAGPSGSSSSRPPAAPTTPATTTGPSSR